MNAEHVTFCIFAVNQFGTGQHPVARIETLKYFADTYIEQCVRLAIADSRTSEAGINTGKSYLEARAK